MKKIILFLIIGIFITACESKSKKEIAIEKALQREESQTIKAKILCKNIILNISRDPSRVIIPQYDMLGLDSSYIAPFRDGVIALFHWTGAHQVRMPNGFGGMNLVNIICEYNIETDKLVKFTVDGEQVNIK